MIPKKIHYCWFNKDRNKPLPRVVQECIASWERLLPDFELILWNEDNFDIHSEPFVKEAYEMSKYGYVADYVRLWVLHNFGGVYLDADVEVVKRFDALLQDPAFMGLENPYALGSAIIGAEPGNPVIKFLLDTYEGKHFIQEDNTPDTRLSNWIFTGRLKEYGYELNNELQVFEHITIYPKENLYPHNRNYITENTLFLHRLMVSHVKQVSVVMPVYNGEKYLREAIDSVLSQTFDNFEFIIVNDGSTDSSEEIIRSYSDSRIVLVNKPNSGIVDSLNLGIKRATGKYIARMDADDIMLPDRLKIQYRFMEENSRVDILASGFEWFGELSRGGFHSTNGIVTKGALMRGNPVGHPTVMMRKRSLEKLPVIYEHGYDYAEDFKLWFHAISHGLQINNIPDIVLKYRQSPHSTGSKYANIQWQSAEKIRKIYAKCEGEKLTAIIPFRNEGDEIERTVVSIKKTAQSIRIILVDDDSNDGYNYEWIADTYHCGYIRNAENKGVAGSRDIGVEECQTPYFVLLDGHMRFYDDNWDEKLISVLENNPGSLVTSNTVVFHRNEDGSYDNEDGAVGRDKFGSYGAFVNMYEPGWEYSAKWTAKKLEEGEVIPVACVLGAVYASSVWHWKRIGGLYGLISYGSDEPLMSIKTWLSGGKCLLIKDWGVGHLYRGKHPYPVQSKNGIYNYLFLIALFSSEEDQVEYFSNYAKRVKGVFTQAYEMYREREADIKEHRKYLQSVFVHDMDYFLKINEKVKK